MHVSEVLLWGLLATGLLTTLLRAGHALHLTRMDTTLLLGTMVTPNRDHAKVIGFAIHFFNGWWIALIYAAFFHGFGWTTWWLGALMGAAHTAFILVAVLPLLPGVHPRMASDCTGPEPTRLLEPPGFLALNYGYRTPLAVLIAHIAYGAVLGGFYEV
ncbi:hypothetical protein [Nitrospira moscoviensis]|uniref:Uncharacterized protein n=1 Tax=Nitrospira moscoviensis TaxID=42253 RepID=A0A0K2GEI8_NITMO|nr:hypothetical protein [Nitrospira moscoviensis]ALA59012.1 conserved membrane protein of unknown function [Nitrospira moscoviensis]